MMCYFIKYLIIVFPGEFQSFSELKFYLMIICDLFPRYVRINFLLGLFIKPVPIRKVKYVIIFSLLYDFHEYFPVQLLLLISYKIDGINVILFHFFYVYTF